MKKTIKLLGVLLAGAVLFGACQEDPAVKPSQKATELTVEPDTIKAEIALTGPVDVQIKANGTWVVVNSLDWVHVDPNKGDGNATVQVTVDANEQDGEQLAPRSGEISFVGAATCSQTLTIAQAGNEDLLLETIPYKINFCESQGTWTIENKTLPSELTYVWQQTDKYGMKASAFVNQCFTAESWLISPVLDLTKETAAILNFDHALNKGSNAKCAVMAKATDSQEWVKLEIPTWPGTAGEDGVYTGTSWDFVGSGDVDLSAFCGKKAQIAFAYGSSDTDAPTWEIQSVDVTNKVGPKFSVPTEDINIRAFDTEASIKVSGNVDWTATASEGASVEPASGKGGLTVTVTVPENTDMENAKEYTVTFKTTAAVETPEYVVKIVQAKAEQLAASTLAEIFEKGAGVYATGELVVKAKAAGNVIVSDGTANMMYYKKNNELAPGQVIKFANADVQDRNGLLQINASEYELLDKTVTPEHGTPVEILTDEAVQAWAGEPQYQYIHFEGVMSSDNRTIKCGDWGIYIVATEGFAGKKVSVHGYANGKANESYKTITTTLVSIEAIEGEEPEPETALKNCGEINAAILAGETALTIKLENPAEITLMGSDKKSIFIQDETGAVLVYNADLYTMLSGAGAVAGAAVQGEFTATATVFKGLPEITAAEVGASNITVTNKFPCLSLTIADLLADFDKYLNCKVKISDVAVNDGWSGSDKNGVIAQGETTIPLYVKTYNSSITVEVPTGAKGNFTGFVAYNNTTKQLTFWEDSGFEATEITGIITVKSSLNLEEGATANLAATVNSGAALSYASSDETVATVSAEGVVTAVKEGTATITVSAPAQGIYTAASAEVAVTVTAAQAGGDVTVLYEDKFDWLAPFIAQYAELNSGKKIGDTVGEANKSANAPNVYTTAPFNTEEFAAAFAEKGYVDLNPSDKLVYAQDQYLKFSKTKGFNTGIELNLGKYVEGTQSVDLSFDYAMMLQGSDTVDEGPVTVLIIGDGTFADGSKRADFVSAQQTGEFFWNKAEAKMLGITPNTKIQFLMGRVIQEDGSYNWHVSGAGRFFLDNILIVK